MTRNSSGANGCGTCVPMRLNLMAGVAACAVQAGLFVAAVGPAQAACSASGSLAPASVVVCSGTQSGRVGQGPGADNERVTVQDGATVATTNSAAISLHDNATVTLGTP